MQVSGYNFYFIKDPMNMKMHLASKALEGNAQFAILRI